MGLFRSIYGDEGVSEMYALADDSMEAPLIKSIQSALRFRAQRLRVAEYDFTDTFRGVFRQKKRNMLYGTLSPGRRLDGAHGVEIEFRLDGEFDDVPIGRSLVIQYSGWPAYDGVHNVRYGLDLDGSSTLLLFRVPGAPNGSKLPTVRFGRNTVAECHSSFGRTILAAFEIPSTLPIGSSIYLQRGGGGGDVGGGGATEPLVEGNISAIHRGNVVSIRMKDERMPYDPRTLPTSCAGLSISWKIASPTRRLRIIDSRATPQRLKQSARAYDKRREKLGLSAYPLLNGYADGDRGKKHCCTMGRSLSSPSWP